MQLTLPLIISIILFALSSNDKYNPFGFNRKTFELRYPETHEVPPFPVCDTVRMPECTSPLGVVGTLNTDSTEVVEALLAARPELRRDTVTYFADGAAFNDVILAAPRSVLVVARRVQRQCYNQNQSSYNGTV